MGNSESTVPGNLNGRTILHITPGLRRGGAEMMLTRLVTALARKNEGYRHVILSLEPGNAFAKEHQEAGIKVVSLGMTSLLGLPWYYPRLRTMVNSLSPSLIHGWMYHGNMAAFHAGANCPVVFSIHNALDAWKHEKWTTRQIIRMGASMARQARTVVYCSNISKTQHEAIGYPTTNAVIIPNGVDVNRFKPDPSARNNLRKTLNIPPENMLFGQVARYHPIKNQIGLLQAFSMATEVIPNMHLLLAGEGCDASNTLLTNQIRTLGLQNKVHLLGARSDVEEILPGLDALVSPSLSEAFPVVLAEAMACELPCIATNVGDSAYIIGDTGMVVDTTDTGAMSKALLEMARSPEKERLNAGKKARLSIVERFEIKNTINRYESLYTTLIQLIVKP